MSLSSGARIGPYQIGEQIGSGGMGVVYRATDQNLKRDVAIKALPESLASDTERLARFQREAEVLASLNHPNIAQIYGLEKGDGATALVMELVEGPTLADRIAKGPVPLDEALGIAMQIADALEAAHRQSIVHRDLKPANIKLRPDGKVKVLDFGIAKALEPESLRTEPQSPMLTTPATQIGVILGTAAYMSPEQAKGQAVDQRADIWAFGCVLYEMLTGQLAFGAEDVPTTLARVIANDTSLDALPASVSPAVRQTIKLCLQKDARKRLADIQDVRLGLEGSFESGSAAMTSLTGRDTGRKRAVWYAGVGAVTLIIGLGAGIFWAQPEVTPRLVTRFDYVFPEDQNLRATNRHVIAISPDGRQFVYNADDGLYLRSMDQVEVRQIPGTEVGVTQPTFSPDGDAIAYWDNSNRLMRIAVSGGRPVQVAEVKGNPYGISWAKDGTIFMGGSEGILRVSANGGVPEVIVPYDGNETLFSPRLLPDGDSLLFSTGGTFLESGRVMVRSLSTGEQKVLLESGGDARYVSTGHLLYALDDGLYAVTFDLDELQVSGGAVPLVQDVMPVVTAAVGESNYDISDNGTLVFVSGRSTAATRTLAWVDRSGREEQLDIEPKQYLSPRISPDGTKVAINARDQAFDIWSYDLSRETLTRVTVDPSVDRFPIWSRDGQRIIFSSARDSGNNNETSIYAKSADGTGRAERLARGDYQAFPTTLLPDEAGLLAYGATSGSDDNDDISLVRIGSENELIPLLNSSFGERMPELSPDGNWLAYVSNETGRDEIYVRPFPDLESGGRVQVSTTGGSEPLWSRDGTELFFRNERDLMVVSVQLQPTFEIGTPAQLLGDQFVVSLGGRTYDISADGQRFLMIRPVEEGGVVAKIAIALDWFSELQQLAPAN